MFCLFRAKEGYNPDCAMGQSFIREDCADLIRDGLGFAVIAIMSIPESTLNIDINKGGSIRSEDRRMRSGSIPIFVLISEMFQPRIGHVREAGHS